MTEQLDVLCSVARSLGGHRLHGIAGDRYVHEMECFEALLHCRGLHMHGMECNFSLLAAIYVLAVTLL